MLDGLLKALRAVWEREAKLTWLRLILLAVDSPSSFSSSWICLEPLTKESFLVCKSGSVVFYYPLAVFSGVVSMDTLLAVSIAATLLF